MRIKMFVRGIALTLTFVAFALLLSTCGGHHRVAPTIQSANRPNIGIPAGKPADTQESISLDDALAELDAYPTPDGVDAELFAQLKDALKEALLCRVRSRAAPTGNNAKTVDGGAQDPTLQGKFASTPPTGESNKVTDLAFGDDGEGNLVLTWHYRNLGDYDQNGVVGISDITPIAMHYGETYEPTDVNCLAAVIDGSGNDAVDIADITPIAMNLEVDCAEYAVELAPTRDGPWDASICAPVVFVGQTERIELRVFLYPPQGSIIYARVVPCDAQGNRGIFSDVIAYPEWGDWPMAGHDRRRTHKSQYVGPQYPGVSWRHWIGRNETCNPVVDARGCVFVGCKRMGLCAIDSDGTSPWDTWPSRYQSGSSALLPTGNTAVSCMSGGLYAFSSAGEELWELDLEYSYGNSPVVSDDSIIYLTGRGRDPAVQAVSAAGELLWAHVTETHILSSAAVADDGTIFYRASGSVVAALQPDGTLKWEWEPSGWVCSGPAIGCDGTVYVGGGEIYALNLDGTVKWTNPEIKAGSGDIAIDDGRAIYLHGSGATLQGTLQALDLTGNLLWRFQARHKSISSPAIGADGTIYFGDGDGYMYALRSDGSLLWECQATNNLGNRAFGTPAISRDGSLLALNNDGFLYSFGEGQPGEAEWTHTWALSQGASPRGVAVDEDGNVYVAVYAWEPETGLRIVILKYDAEGTLLYSKGWGRGERSGSVGVVVDSQGCAYILLQSENIGDSARGTGLLKFSPDGDLLWQKAWSGEFCENPSGIAVDEDDCIYIAGSRSDVAFADWRMFLLKCDEEGNTLYAKTWYPGRMLSITDLAITSDGNMHVIGSLGDYPSDGKNAGLVLVFTSEGELIRSSVISGETESSLSISAVCCDGESNLYLGAGGKLLKLNPHGQLMFCRRYDAGISSVCVSPGGLVHVVGSSRCFASGGSYDLFYAACHSDGTPIVEKVWTESGSSRGRNVLCDDQGNVYIAGSSKCNWGLWFDAVGEWASVQVTVEPIEGELSALHLNEAELQGLQNDLQGIIDSFVDPDDPWGEDVVLLLKNPPL